MLNEHPVLAIKHDVRVALRTKIDSLCFYGAKSSLLKTWNADEDCINLIK